MSSSTRDTVSTTAGLLLRGVPPLAAAAFTTMGVFETTDTMVLLALHGGGTGASAAVMSARRKSSLCGEARWLQTHYVQGFVESMRSSVALTGDSSPPTARAPSAAAATAAIGSSIARFSETTSQSQPMTAGPASSATYPQPTTLEKSEPVTPATLPA